MKILLAVLSALSLALVAPLSAGAAEPTGAITGTVVNSTGTPVGNIKVTAKDTSGVAAVARTDRKGHFFLTHLAPSSYGLKFSTFNRERVTYATEWSGDKLSYTGSLKIRVALGDKKSGLREVVATGSDISGRITINGRPATAADGVIVSGPKVGNGDGAASVSASPTFHFRDVDFGNQVLTVTSATGAFAPLTLADPRDGNLVIHTNGVDKVTGVVGDIR